MNDWLALAKDAFESSTDYMDANYRKTWDADIRAFHSQHPMGSKYLSDAFKHRSKGFNPKTRAIIRKNEAAAAVALFSNVDVTNVDAIDYDNPQSVASAFVNKELLQYRLTKTLPWFKISMASFQEAMTIGIVASYQYWDYESEKKTETVPDAFNEDGTQAQREIRIPLMDQPCMDLRPAENLRFHPSADWLDPVNKSPYLIDMIPMFVGEVKRMATALDDKTGKPRWKKLNDDELRQGLCGEQDSTRIAREPGRQARHEQEEQTLSDFDTVWVHRNFMRVDGVDHVFYTLMDKALLSDAKPVTEAYPHLARGKRPYVMGICVIESQRAVPGGLARLAAPQQTEANEIRNERRDNVKLVLNKRWFVARGKQVDTDSLLRNSPGAVTIMNDVERDVKEVTWPDVTQSAYAEEDRINLSLDDLVGNFSGSTRQANTAMNDTLGGAKLGHQTESIMQEYVLRTWIETWCEPVLQQLLALEQYYESDATVIALCAKKAKLWQRFGISQITDELLRQQLSLTVNVGMGAANPTERLRKFMGATETAIKLSTEAQGTGFNVQEGIKEIYSLAGMRDGTRFFPEGGNPQMQKAMQMIQQLQGELKSKQAELQMKAQLEMQGIASTEKIKAAEIQVDSKRIDGDLQLRMLELQIQQQTLEIEKMKLQADAEGRGVDSQLKVADMQRSLDEAAQNLQLERERMQLERERMVMEAQKHQAEMQSCAMDHEMKGEELNNKRAELEIKQTPVKENAQVVAAVKTQLADVSKAIQAMQAEMAKPDPEPVSAKYERDAQGRPVAAIITKSDGTTRRVAVTLQ